MRPAVQIELWDLNMLFLIGGDGTHQAAHVRQTAPPDMYRCTQYIHVLQIRLAIWCKTLPETVLSVVPHVHGFEQSKHATAMCCCQVLDCPDPIPARLQLRCQHGLPERQT